MFGLPVPNNVIATKGQPDSYWGARAIFKENSIDLLHDRQNFTPEGVEAPHLIHWVNKTGLPWLREQVKGVNPGSNKVFAIADGNYGLVASPKQSYGYLYIGCYFYNPKHARYELQTIPDNVKIVDEDDLKNPKKMPNTILYSGVKIPSKKDRVRIKFNELGTGVVADYFVEAGWLGVRVKLDKQPKWHENNRPDYPYALVFGNEVELDNLS